MNEPADPSTGSELTTGAAPVPAAARRSVVVSPEDVWQDPARATRAPPGPEPVEQTFFAPIALVLTLSSVLLALALAALVLVLWLHR